MLFSIHCGFQCAHPIKGTQKCKTEWESCGGCHHLIRTDNHDPHRCDVPKLRYNEFGEAILNSFYLLQSFTFLKNYFSYRIILLFPSNILKKLVVKMKLYPFCFVNTFSAIIKSFSILQSSGTTTRATCITIWNQESRVWI
jgi:hypothetical protein